MWYYFLKFCTFRLVQTFNERPCSRRSLNLNEENFLVLSTNDRLGTPQKIIVITFRSIKRRTSSSIKFPINRHKVEPIPNDMVTVVRNKSFKFRRFRSNFIVVFGRPIVSQSNTRPLIPEHWSGTCNDSEVVFTKLNNLLQVKCLRCKSTWFNRYHDFVSYNHMTSRSFTVNIPFDFPRSVKRRRQRFSPRTPYPRLSQ